MIKKYTALAKSLLAEVKNTDLIKLAIYTSIAAAATIWPIIALEQAGYGTSKALTIYSIENGAGLFLLTFFSVFIHRKNLLKRIWLAVTWLAALCWIALALLNFDLSSPICMALLFVAVITSHAAAVCLFADTLDQVQTGDAGAIKLALFFLVVPLTKVIFISLGGFLAEFSFTYVAYFLGGALFISNLVWHDHVVLHTVKAASTRKIWQAFDSSKRLMLIALSSLFNALHVPVRFVFVPLYFYEKTDGSPGQVGLVLALLGVVALIAHSAKSYLQGSDLNTFNLMIVGISCYSLIPLVWYLGYDTPWIVGTALLVGQVLTVVWSYGFFAEFRKLSDDSPTVCTQQWQIMNSMAVGASCITLAFVTEDLMQFIHTYLLIEFIVLACFITFFVCWWHVFSKKPTW